MKRLFLTSALVAALPLTAHAEDFLLRADLARATVYGSGAEMERALTVTLPAGQHRLLVAMPDLGSADLIQIEGPDGLRFGAPQAIYGYRIDEGELDNPVEAAAREAVETALDAIEAAQDNMAEADATIRAIEAQQAYLAAVLRGGENGVSLPEDPALVAQFLATIGSETARVSAELQAAQVARRALVEEMTDRQTEYQTAAAALQRLRPFGVTTDLVEIAVTADADTTADLVLSYGTYEAGWQPSYDLRLDSETGALAVERYVTLYASGNARWEDVAVRFSTETPTRQREPQILTSQPARIYEPVEAAPTGRVGGYADLEVGAIAAPAPVIALESSAQVEFSGLSVTYDYATPVTVGETGEVLLPFDALALEMETEARAVPRYDATAFLVAMGENDTGEPILPGLARFYRDGALVGEGGIPLIATGAEVELAFGPLDHLQLVWIDRSLAEGDRGVFVSSTTQERSLAFGVENTGSDPEDVRILYSTPFAEQEDLELDLTLTPQPDERDVDDRRGVHAWNVTVAPGATEIIEMSLEFEFPEGQVLDWRP